MFLSFKDRKLFYTDSGKGRVIVLLHGYLESADVFKNIAERLSSGFRVITVDLPGHGLSDACGTINTMEYMATAVRAVLDSAGVSRIFLVGHSMGGYVTLAFLELFPELLSGYCLLHSHPMADKPEAVEKRKLNIGIVEGDGKDLMIPDFIKNLFAHINAGRLKKTIDKSVSLALKTKKQTIVADLKGMMARPDRTSLVESGKLPFLWILGTMDGHIDFRSVQQNVTLPANATVVVLNNSGHMGFIEEEDLSVRAIEDFVKQII
jgi:pimeloyl-ACP methyl ester carboxylesterase